jgi:hypothetical protein
MVDESQEMLQRAKPNGKMNLHAALIAQVK